MPDTLPPGRHQAGDRHLKSNRTWDNLLEGLYYDTATQHPTFASVQVGIVGRHKLTFVPLDGARVAPDHVRVMVDKKTVKDALTLDIDGSLTAAQEPELFAHYGLAYEPGASGERRLGRR